MIIPWGCDFTYSNPRVNFGQMDSIIKFVNQINKKNITLMYSTPSEYLDAIEAQNLKWPVKYDDGFPYSDMPNEFWTGFFSSRAGSKKMIRDTSSYMHASEKLFAKEVIKQNVSDEKVSQILTAKDKIFDTLGVLQHHDAVTGTEKQHVADDYLMKANNAVRDSDAIYEQIL